MDFDFDFNKMVNRFDRQFRNIDKMFDRMSKKMEMEFDQMGNELGGELEWKKDQPEIKLTNISASPEHHRYDFTLKDVPAGNVTINAYEDRYTGSCYLSLSVQDKKDNDKTYEYTTAPDGKVLNKRLVNSEELKLLGNSSQEQPKQLENSSNPASPTKSKSKDKAGSDKGTEGTLTNTNAKDKNHKHYVHVSSSGSSMNAMSYRLPDDVTERELNDIKAERNEKEGLLSIFIPRRQNVVSHSWVNGTKVMHIPIHGSNGNNAGQA